MKRPTLNLNKFRNKFIDTTVNLLNKAKYVPDQHTIALNVILDNEQLSDAEKLTQMRKYFVKAAAELTTNA